MPIRLNLKLYERLRNNNWKYISLNNYQNNKKNNKYDISEYYAFQTSHKLH